MNFIAWNIKCENIVGATSISKVPTGDDMEKLRLRVAKSHGVGKEEVEVYTIYDIDLINAKEVVNETENYGKA